MITPNRTPSTQQWQSPHTLRIPTQRQGEPRFPAPAPRRRRRWPWIVGAIVLLIVVVAAVANGGKGRTPAAAAALPAPAASAAAAPNPAAVVAPAPVATAPTSAPAPAVSAPTVYKGRGDDVVTITKDPGVAIVQFECPKCSGNTVVKTDGADSLLVNEIGAYRGKHLIDERTGGTTSTLEIKASGSWTVTVSSGLAAATVQTAGTPVSGKGDDVVLIADSSSKAHITNKGPSNFAVWVISIDSGSMDLAINEIGGYDGTVVLDGPAVVKVASSGSWTITPS